MEFRFHCVDEWSTILSVASSVHIIYATGSGHTEYVVDVLMKHWRKKKRSLKVEKQYAEQASPEDLLKGNILILGCGSWNTGGVEGQMQPHMYSLLKGRAKEVDLAGKQVAIIALGDERYYYTARSGEHLRQFVLKHGGKVFGQPLMVVNEPYGQEAKIEKWGDTLLKLVSDSVKA